MLLKLGGGGGGGGGWYQELGEASLTDGGRISCNKVMEKCNGWVGERARTVLETAPREGYWQKGGGQ